MTDLLVIDVSHRDGKGHVVLADQAHDPHTSRLITLEFPLHHELDGPYPEREATIVKDAQAILREASAALLAR